jgi:hypothetical protein
MVWAVAGAGVAAVLVGAVSQSISPASSSQALSLDLSPAVPSESTASASPADEAPAGPLSAVAAGEVRVLAGGPVMAMTCPGGGRAAAQFGHRITAAAPYTVTIDYGDGDRYSNDDRHLELIFAHKYLKRGTFTVGAVLKDATGQTTTATCAYTWTARHR